MLFLVDSGPDFDRISQMQTDPPASSKHVSESAIQFRATEILRASISQNTHKMYQTAWRSFRDFVGQRNGSIEPSIDDAVKFISYLSCQGFASSTIKSYIYLQFHSHAN